MFFAFIVVYKETLPNELPPSYRGQAVKYSYKITIGTQRVNSPIRLLRVPFRVLVLNGEFYLVKVCWYLYFIVEMC